MAGRPRPKSTQPVAIRGSAKPKTIAVSGPQAVVRRDATPALNPRQRNAADLLKQTVKGSRPSSGTKGKGGGGGGGQIQPGGVVVGGNPSVTGGHSVNVPVPKRPTAENFTAEQNAHFLAQIVAGQPAGFGPVDVSTLSKDQIAEIAEGTLVLRANEALGGLPQAVHSAVSGLYQTVTGENQPAASVADLPRPARAPASRSDALKKAWETRRKLYGPSGTKE